MANDWPYGNTHEIIDAIHRKVPRWIDPDKRSDICQSLCLLVVESKISIEELERVSGMKELLKNLRVKRVSTRREYFSMDNLPEASA